jgi:hypothetical protein
MLTASSKQLSASIVRCSEDRSTACTKIVSKDADSEFVKDGHNDLTFLDFRAANTPINKHEVKIKRSILGFPNHIFKPCFAWLTWPRHHLKFKIGSTALTIVHDNLEIPSDESRGQIVHSRRRFNAAVEHISNVHVVKNGKDTEKTGLDRGAGAAAQTCDCD